MLIVGMIQWWYTKGWGMFLHGLSNRLKNAVDFFSIRLLVRHMFAPFRQISANTDLGPSLDAKFHAFLDRLVSRVIGAFVRFFLLILGTIIIILQAVIGVLVAIIWPLIPLAPFACIILTVAGVTFS